MKLNDLGVDDVTGAVTASFAATPDPRLRELMTVLTRHLHDFVRETGLTEGEWAGAIRFLTATGQKCDDVRQEFILLSDVLGVSQLVVAQNHDRPGAATEQTVFGPFHVVGAPQLENGADVARGATGASCFVRARVTFNGAPVSGAIVDTWQSDGDGFYDVQDPRWSSDVMRLRAVFRSDDSGCVAFRTVLPSSYPIPTDGSVGELLDATRRHPMRPAHIHFMICKTGFDTLITHVFVRGDAYLDSDAVFGVRTSCIGDYVRHAPGLMPDGHRSQSDFYTLDYEFVLSTR